MVKLSNDTKIDATVSGTEKMKYNIGVNADLYQMVKQSNDTKIDATVSGTEKLKYNIGINESEYVMVKSVLHCGIYLPT